MSDLSNKDDFGDVSGFYPRRREGLGNFFIGMLTGLALVIGLLLLAVGIWGNKVLPSGLVATQTSLPSVTLNATLTFTPSISFTPTSETPSATPTVVCPSEYVVQSGDLLSTIAKKCGVSVEAITALNPTLDANNIQVGQKILLPPPGTGFSPTAIPSGLAPRTVIPITVQQGDNLEIIAARCLSTVDDLVKRNKITDPNYLTVGTVLQCLYGIATPVPTRASPTFGPTPTQTSIQTSGSTPSLTPTPTQTPKP
jgi:LysM repeat protein